MSYFKPGGLPHVSFRPLGYAVLLLLLIIACMQCNGLLQLWLPPTSVSVSWLEQFLVWVSPAATSLRNRYVAAT